MCCAGKVLATDARIQVDDHAAPLVGSLCRVGRAVPRAARRRSTLPKKAARLPPPPLSPFKIQNPSSPNDNLLCQYHLNLAQKAYPSLSICNWLEEGDVHMAVGGFPFSAGGFADLWRGSLDNRLVAVKSYRRYLSVDPSRIFLVG
jgi:hypothetical protein